MAMYNVPTDDGVRDDVPETFRDYTHDRAWRAGAIALAVSIILVAAVAALAKIG